MPQSRWYCATCDTHGGGPPNHMTPQEHVDFAHDGVAAQMETDGDFRDFKRKQQHRLGLDIDER